jgi:hypothetical protein
MLSGSGSGVTDAPEGNWLCLDDMLAARLAGYEQTEAAAANVQVREWRLPDDWRLAANTSREVQALKEVVGDNDDWVVLDGSGHLEAAE